MFVRGRLPRETRTRDRLQRLAGHEARAPPGSARRLPGEGALQRRGAVHEAEAEVAQDAQRQAFVGEEPVQRVRRPRERHGIEPAVPFVAGERLPAARVEAEADGVDDPFGQRRRVAEPEVQPLTGERMDLVGGVAEQRDPFRDEAAGEAEAERVRDEFRFQPDGAEVPAESGPERREPARLGAGEQGPGGLLPFRPDQGGAVPSVLVGERQDREGAGR